MRFGFDTEQSALHEAVRRFLDETADRDRLRALVESGQEYDASAWQRAVDELGLTAIGVPAELGGAGGGAVERALVLELHGRALCRSPYLATALAAPVLQAAGGPVAERLLPLIAEGKLLASFAVPVGAGSLAQTPVVTDGEARLTGLLESVLDAPSADVLIVPAHTDGVPGLFVVETAPPDRAPTDAGYSYDLTASIGPVELSATVGERLPDPAGDLVDRSYALAALAIAAVQLGGAAACLDSAVGYARTRTQFGRPIGSFQAIKHRCADVLLRVEAARSLVYHTAWLADREATDDLVRSVAMTKAWCSDTYREAADANLLTHGGIGFTWEHDAHLHVRRSRFLALLLGSADDHRSLAISRTLLRTPGSGT